MSVSTNPNDINAVFGGMSASEHDSLGESFYGRQGYDYVPSLDDRRRRLLRQSTSAVGMFVGNTRLAPFTGKFGKARGVLFGVGSGGPAGLPISNTGGATLEYQGFTTVYDTGGAHAGGRRLKVFMRTNTHITLGSDTEYYVILYPHAEMNSTGRFLPPPKDLSGCYIYRVNGSDVPGYAGVDLVGVANASPYINLDLVSAPTLAGYTGLNPTGAGGDLVFIYPNQRTDGDPLDFQFGDDEHELCWSASAAFVGPKGIWWPYQTFQRKTNLCNASQLVQVAAPCAAASINTDQNWYCKPTVMVAPEQFANGQRCDFQLSGDYAGTGGTKFIEVLVFAGAGEESGWDPASSSWFDPGPYSTFAGASWDEGTLTLTVAGSGIGDLGAACLWVTTGVNSVPKPYLIDSQAGDDITLFQSLQSGGAASAIAGYVGGIAVAGGVGITYVGGMLGAPVFAFQSPAFAPAARLVTISLVIEHSGGTSFTSMCTFRIAGQTSAGGLSVSGGGISANNDPLVNVTRQALVTVAPSRVATLLEHMGFTVMVKVGDGTSSGEILMPGTHGWYAGQPYDPSIGLGYALKFSSAVTTADTIAVLASYAQDGTHRLRLTKEQANYEGSCGAV